MLHLAGLAAAWGWLSVGCLSSPVVVMLLYEVNEGSGF